MANIKAIRFKNYKSYGDEYSCIDMDKRITVFIGRNNCGKSSCIDIIEFVSDAMLFQKNKCDIIIDSLCEASELNKLNLSSIVENEKKLYYNQLMSFRLSVHRDSYAETYYYDARCTGENQVFGKTLIPEALVEPLNQYLKTIVIRRLNAERDIVPEIYSDSMSLSQNGNGACSLINYVLNYAGTDEKIIQNGLLDALNGIMAPDSVFSGITVQKINKEKWEVYLYEGNNKIPLSKTGTGLKTIILVLLNLLVMPKLKHYSDNDICYFAFEELENNLHPALQRRLFDYIDHFVKEHRNTYVFLTTHSHIAINTFANSEDAQILHVIKNDGVSSIHKIDDFISKCELLNDLDVRASDLLQSNGIIWVEGPSDRVYIKRWLDIVSERSKRSIIEGRDYQFLYYGGRLLSHYSAEDQATDNNLISILTTNRNSAIVIDSDKKTKNARINETKKRINSEFLKLGMLCWITKGKEIENYVPFQTINSAYNSNLDTQCGQYELFPDYINSVKKNFQNEKVAFANKVSQFITAENYGILDVKEKVKRLYEEILKWNNK